jgi:hypothetical protein
MARVELVSRIVTRTLSPHSTSWRVTCEPRNPLAPITSISAAMPAACPMSRPEDNIANVFTHRRVRRPATFTSIGPTQITLRRSSTISTTNGTREADTDTPATTTTRPLYVGTGYDLGFAADVDRPWSAAVDSHHPALPDFTKERRWTSAVLSALGIVVLAALVIAVITVAHQSSEPTERAPVPAPPSTAAVAPSPAAPTTSAPAPSAPPAYSSVTATASTVVAPPPPVIQPGEPQPKPGVRQRLHDLFPRLFPGH